MERLLQAVDQVAADPVAQLFVYSIVGVFAVGLVGHLLGTVFRARAFQRFSAATPMLCTTIGVLGTFAGIFIGLLDFDVARIDASVPQLLLGLKIAFGTSIVGLFAAITFRVIQTILPLRQSSAGATAEDIHSALLEIRTEVARGSAEVGGGIDALRRAVSSDGETSLLSQMQKMRLEMVDGQRELIGEFRTFATTMAENNSKALIEALEQVIRDFNTKLTEQFGENFKQLNEAVGALLVWQENYRAHVEKLEASFAVALDGLGRAEQALGQVREHTAAIPAATNEMISLVGNIRSGIDELTRSLASFADMRTKAVEALPVIEGNINRLTTDFSSLVSLSMREAETGLSKQRDAFGELHHGYGELLAGAGKAQAEFSGAVNATLVAIREQIDRALHEQGRLIESSAKQIQAEINEAWERTEEAIQKRMEALDKELQSELDRAMTVFGRHLASISEKFVSDYTPLTERLRDLVKVSARVT